MDLSPVYLHPVAGSSRTSNPFLPKAAMFASRAKRIKGDGQCKAGKEASQSSSKKRTQDETNPQELLRALKSLKKLAKICASVVDNPKREKWLLLDVDIDSDVVRGRFFPYPPRRRIALE